MQNYNISKVKHGFQNNRNCKLQNMQKRIIGCWKRDFDKIILTNCQNKSLIWIYRWTHWQPTQFRQAGSLPSNHTEVDWSGLLTTQTANLETFRFGPSPTPDVTFPNHCQYNPVPTSRHERQWLSQGWAENSPTRTGATSKICPTAE